MFSIETVQLILLLAILQTFSNCALWGYQTERTKFEPCSNDEFTCRRVIYRNLYWCIKAYYLCDGNNDCSNQKDEICDGQLHTATGICHKPDEKHCKDVSEGGKICSDGCTQCKGKEECFACAVNFSGKHCNETCPSGKFGLSCEYDCEYLLSKNNELFSLCSHDFVCDSPKDIRHDCRATCECKRANYCKPGWIGNRCQVACSGFTFGRLCSKKCGCVQANSIGCDNESGACKCKPHYYGKNCERACDLECLERKVNTLADEKATLEKSFQDYKTAVAQKFGDQKSLFEKNLQDHKAATAQKFGYQKSLFEQKLNRVISEKVALEQNLNEHKSAMEQELTYYKESVENNLTSYLNEHRDEIENEIGEAVSEEEFERNLTEYKTAIEKNLADHKTASDDHKSEVLQALSGHKTLLEQNLASHRSSLEQKLEKLMSDKAALEEQVGDYNHHLRWYSSLTCVAFVILAFAIRRVYLKNRKLKASLKTGSVGCPESPDQNSPDRWNLFRDVRCKLRRLTQTAPSCSTDQPTYATSLLEETNRINESIYEAIDNLKEQNELKELNVNDAIRMPDS